MRIAKLKSGDSYKMKSMYLMDIAGRYGITCKLIIKYYLNLQYWVFVENWI